MVAPAGAGPWPQITSTPPLRASWRMTGTSPPGPLRCGSTTWRVKAVATAASNALPPFSSTPMPTAVAIQWVEVTTPKVPSISGRVVKGLGLTLLIGGTPPLHGAASGIRLYIPALAGDQGRPQRDFSLAGLRCGGGGSSDAEGAGQRERLLAGLSDPGEQEVRRMPISRRPFTPCGHLPTSAPPALDRLGRHDKPPPCCVCSKQNLKPLLVGS